MRRVTRLTPRMVRITFSGEQLAGFESTGPTEHIRVYMPDSETGELLLPTMGPEGNAFPEGREPPPPGVHGAPVGPGDGGVGPGHSSSRQGARSEMGCRSQ